MRVILESEDGENPTSLLRLTVDSSTIGEHLTSAQACAAINWVLAVRELQRKAQQQTNPPMSGLHPLAPDASRDPSIDHVFNPSELPVA